MSYLADPNRPLAPLQFGADAPASIGEAALGYRAMGLREVALEHRSKQSVGKWGIARPPEALDSLYKAGANVGIVLGTNSRNLADIDCDWPEVGALLARSATLAECPTFGRENLAASHFLFVCEGEHRITKFGFTKDEAAALGLPADDKAMVVEIRGSGHYTMFPPSVHPSGVRIAWKRPGAPPVLSLAEVEKVIARVAVLAVFVRKWPRVAGNRDELALALTGACIGAGMSDEAANEAVSLVAELAGDEEHAKRGTKASATREKMEAGDPCTGLTRLCELLGIASVAPKLVKWWTWGQPKRKGKGRGRDEDDKSGRDVGRILLAQRPRPIVHYQDEWLEYREACYRPVEDGAIRREVYETLEREGLPTGAAMVSNVVDALESLALVPKHEHTPPSWMDGRAGPKPGELVALSNGLLHLPSGELLRADPALFTLNALDYAFDPNAPKPERWIRFLESSYEPDCIPVIQEWFGNGLTDDTSQQKILTIIGPPRSGKGTTVRIFVRVVGSSNVCSPRLSALGETFGLASLIGKRSAILSDMRMGKGTDVAAVAETMLRVSGEDDVNIPRKHRDDWQGRLPTRFLILSNEPPSITDPSGALASRFIVLQMNTSFLGRENPNLTDELLSELPGILNWAIEGWRRLKAQGRYSVPASSAALVEHVRRVSSPIDSFVSDECEFVQDAMESKAALHESYREWCIREGVMALSRELFAKQFIAATLGRAKPGKSRKAGEGKHVPVFFGVRLQTAPIEDYSLYDGSGEKGGTPRVF